MKGILCDKRGFTFTEILFAATISVFVLGSILSVWTFTHKILTGETERTGMRVELLKFKETIRRDIRESYVPYMAFYPKDTGEYSAISMPLADVDENGFYQRDEEDNIVWDKTVIYHIADVGGGERHLRRSVIEPWTDLLETKSERNKLIRKVVNGTIVDPNALDLITENLDYFTIAPDAPIVDFYDISDDPIKARNIVFGYTTLEPGAHTVRFKVTGKNPSSTGYALGIDNIKIDPCGSDREAEYYNSSYAQAGSITSSGDTITVHNDSIWGNSNYLEYGTSASAKGEWVQFNYVAYDLWRESSFANVSKNNVTEYGDEVYMKLEVPEDREEGKELIAWSANSQTQDDTDGGTDGDLPAYPIVIRTLIKNELIENDADLIRILLRAPSGNPTKFSAVYITRKKVQGDDTDPDGFLNQDPSGLEIEEYHRHQRILFKDIFDGDSDSDTDEVLEEVWIPAGEEMWSEWMAFPLVKELSDTPGDLDYLVTICIPDLESAGVFPNARDTFNKDANDCKYWQGTDAQSFCVTLSKNCIPEHNNNRFYAESHGLTTGVRVSITGTPIPPGLAVSSLANLVGTVDLTSNPDWSSQVVYYAKRIDDDLFQVSKFPTGDPQKGFGLGGSDVKYAAIYSDQKIFGIAGIDTWTNVGTVESQIFDTTLDDPFYTTLAWSEASSTPVGTERSVKVRSSDNSSMFGASSWDTVTARTSTPSTVGAGSGRYVQFFASLSTGFSWENSVNTMTYPDYIDAQILLSPWEFPDVGDPRETKYSSTWIDDVAIKWDGEEHICMIRGDIARKSNYGRVKVIVDGEDLIKVLRVNIGLLLDFEGRQFIENNTIEIEPREDRKIRDL